MYLTPALTSPRPAKIRTDPVAYLAPIQHGSDDLQQIWGSQTHFGVRWDMDGFTGSQVLFYLQEIFIYYVTINMAWTVLH